MTYKTCFSALAVLACTACTSLTFQEQQQLTQLQYQGITVDRAPGGWEKPNSPFMAGVLNILPGVGNMYLASGNAGDSTQWIYAAGNFLTWPLSVLWGIPEAAIDANTINKREMLNYYKYGNQAPMQVRIEPHGNAGVYQPQPPHRQAPQYRQYPSQGYGDFYNGSYN